MREGRGAGAERRRSGQDHRSAVAGRTARQAVARGAGRQHDGRRRGPAGRGSASAGCRSGTAQRAVGLAPAGTGVARCAQAAPGALRQGRASRARRPSPSGGALVVHVERTLPLERPVSFRRLAARAAYGRQSVASEATLLCCLLLRRLHKAQIRQLDLKLAELVLRFLIVQAQTDNHVLTRHPVGRRCDRCAVSGLDGIERPARSLRSCDRRTSGRTW